MHPFLTTLFQEKNVIDLGISADELEALILSVLSVTDERLLGRNTYREEEFSGEQFFTVQTLQDSLEANSRMLHLFQRLADTQPENQMLPEGFATPARKAKAFMDNFYSEPIRIQDVADALHLHPNYLSAVFKREYGQSPQKYLHTLRMSHAAMLLALTDYPVSAVSDAVGYRDSLHFSASFKNDYQMSPSEYREKKKQKS